MPCGPGRGRPEGSAGAGANGRPDPGAPAHSPLPVRARLPSHAPPRDARPLRCRGRNPPSDPQPPSLPRRRAPLASGHKPDQRPAELQTSQHVKSVSIVGQTSVLHFSSANARTPPCLFGAGVRPPKRLAAALAGRGDAAVLGTLLGGAARWRRSLDVHRPKSDSPHGVDLILHDRRRNTITDRQPSASPGPFFFKYRARGELLLGPTRWNAASVWTPKVSSCSYAFPQAAGLSALYIHRREDVTSRPDDWIDDGTSLAGV